MKELKDSSVSKYNPKWIKNTESVRKTVKKEEKPALKIKEKIGWDNF